MKRTAVVVGSTGVTGKAIVKHLLNSQHYSKVISLSRKPLDIGANSKLESIIVDFANDSWARYVSGDDLFSALGTTLKQAGSKQAQFAIDYQLQADVAKAASSNGVERLFLVSSPYAHASSPFFYVRIKGKLENYVKSLDFNKLFIFQPPIIQGDRPDQRIAETISADIINGITSIIPGGKSIRPILADDLGRAIVNCAENTDKGAELIERVTYLNSRKIRQELE